MAVYTDSKDRNWTVRLSVPVLIKACRKLGVTLDNLIRLDLQVADVLEALPIVVEADLKERGMTAEQFLEDLSPSDLAGFAKAVGDAVKEAFPGVDVPALGGGGGADPTPQKTGA